MSNHSGSKTRVVISSVLENKVTQPTLIITREKHLQAPLKGPKMQRNLSGAEPKIVDSSKPPTTKMSSLSKLTMARDRFLSS